MILYHKKGYTMSFKEEIDENFYNRADEYIALANKHINETHARPALVNNSLMYASARFSAWIVAASFTNADDMKADKANAIEFFTSKFKEMLEEHFDDYASHYDEYMGIKE